MRLLVLALVLMAVSSCLIAKASKVDHNKDKWRRRGLAFYEENSTEYNALKAKYERTKPHVNVGSIGHVDRGQSPGHVDNVENEKVFRPTQPSLDGVDHNNDKGYGRGLVDNNEGNAKVEYPSSNGNDHRCIPRRGFPYGGDTGGSG